MNESKAARYQRRQRQAVVASWATAGLMLAAVAFTPLGSLLLRLSTSVTPGSGGHPSMATVALFLLGVAALCELATLPTVVFRSHTQGAANARSTDSRIGGRLAEALVILPAVTVAGLLIHVATQVAGAGWWLVAGGGLALAFTLAVRIGPAIAGRAAGLRPLSRPELARRLSGLASNVGVPVSAIQEWRVDETSPTVAMVAGIGSGRRVLVAADVVRDWTDDEVEVVVAHELAHHVHGDLWRSLLLDALVMCAGLLASHLFVVRAGAWLGAQGVSDPVSLPAIAFVTLAVWLAATPLRHAQSRGHERRADRFALKTTGRADTFATVVRRASARYLADERPSLITRWLFHRHPSVEERLELARQFGSAGSRSVTGAATMSRTPGS